MKKLNYCWTYDPKGQYVDGHEREDVVAYRQNIFLPRWANIKAQTHDWLNGQPDPLLHERKIVVWFHDESTFYANDRRVAQWAHKSKAAKPYAKGEGASQMVADLVSADYGWLRSPDGEEEAWVLFKEGKIVRGISRRRIYSSKLRRPSISWKNIILMRIMFLFMTTPQLT
jgi:hypothetical protein